MNDEELRDPFTSDDDASDGLLPDDGLVEEDDLDETDPLWEEEE